MPSKRFAIGVFTHPAPDLKAHYFSESLRGIFEGLAAVPHSLLVNPPLKDLDGALLLGPSDQDPALAFVIKTGLPAVLMQASSDRLPTVDLDNVGAARKVVEHLISLGHKRIAVIDGRLYVSNGRDRHEGYRQALAAHGLPIDPGLAVEAEFSEEKGRSAMLRFLALPNPPSAVFAANDNMALGALQALGESGKRVPEDVALAGFDDAAAAAPAGLTTFRQPFFEIGREGARRLGRILSGTPSVPDRKLVDGELVVRRSCGADLARK